MKLEQIFVDDSVLIEAEIVGELRKIIKKGKPKKLRWKDGSAIVDRLTAGAILAVHDALAPNVQRKFRDRVNISLVWFKKLSTFSFKKTKLGSG